MKTLGSPFYISGGNEMYWRIWFVMYRNGTKIGSGLWHQRYIRRGNAVRWGKYRFGNPRYHKHTGDIYTYDWVVSQTNPWR